MPQASDELRAMFPGHDREALDVLEINFTEKAGVFRRKDSKYIPIPREEEALDYLFYEWDYAYSPEAEDAQL